MCFQFLVFFLLPFSSSFPLPHRLAHRHCVHFNGAPSNHSHHDFCMHPAVHAVHLPGLVRARRQCRAEDAGVVVVVICEDHRCSCVDSVCALVAAVEYRVCVADTDREEHILTHTDRNTEKCTVPTQMEAHAMNTHTQIDKNKNTQTPKKKTRTQTQRNALQTQTQDLVPITACAHTHTRTHTHTHTPAHTHTHTQMHCANTNTVSSTHSCCGTWECHTS